MMYPHPKNSSHEANLPTMRVTHIEHYAREEFGAGIMSDLLFKLSVNQLCAVIRHEGIDVESNTMLTMLESLVIAGEIPFPDFMGRVQNLFPQVFDKIDSALLAKLSAYRAD